jgi:hypothetical protein
MTLDGSDTAWPQGASGGVGTFNITCATRGNVGLQTDSNYALRVHNTRMRGAEAGHYHFNGMQAAVQQADFFIDHLSDFRQGDLLALDSEYETSTGVQAMNPANAAAFFDRLHLRTGGYPYQGMALYINRSIRSEWDWSGVWARGVRKWIASPGVDPGDWDLWQYSEAGGIDHNYARTSLAEMAGADMATPLEILQAEFDSGQKNPDGSPRTVQLWQALQAVFFYGDHIYAQNQATQTAIGALGTVAGLPDDQLQALAGLIAAKLPPTQAATKQDVMDALQSLTLKTVGASS